MKIIYKLFITAGVAFGLTYFLEGVHFSDFFAALIFGVVLGLLNMFVKPILKLIGLPFTFLSFGLFSLVINAIVILLADYFVQGLVVDGFWWALIFSVSLSVITSLIFGIFLSEKNS